MIEKKKISRGRRLLCAIRKRNTQTCHNAVCIIFEWIDVNIDIRDEVKDNSYSNSRTIVVSNNYHKIFLSFWNCDSIFVPHARIHRPWSIGNG